MQFEKIKLCIYRSNKYNMLWASAHSFYCNCFKFSPISQAVVLGLNFNGFPLWHLKGVHRGGNSSLLLLTCDNFPLGMIHKIHLKNTRWSQNSRWQKCPSSRFSNTQNFYVFKIYLNLFEISNWVLKFENPVWKFISNMDLSEWCNKRVFNLFTW